MDDHTVRSLQIALRGMRANAPILVRVDGTLRPVSLVRPAWVVDGQEAPPGSSAGDYAVVLITASD
jgi:hypothetical protein